MNAIQPTEQAGASFPEMIGLSAPALNEKSSMINVQSSMNTTPARTIDTLALPFPKTLDELAALDATREIPYLKALCNRRHIHVPGPNPTPSEIIPIIQQHLRNHEQNRPDPRYQTDILIEWNTIHEELSDFLSQLADLEPKKNFANVGTGPLLGLRPHAAHSTIDALPNIPTPPAPNIPSPSALSVSSSVNSVLLPDATVNPKLQKTSSHFQDSDQPAPKSSAISTDSTPPSGTLGHLQAAPQKFSSTGASVTSVSTIPPNTPDEPPRKKEPHIKPLLSTLSPQTIETIIAICDETKSYQEAAAKIREDLGIKISTASLCKLYTNYRVDEDAQTRSEIEAAYSKTDSDSSDPKPKNILAIAKDQLQLRLLELSVRADQSTSQIKELFQIVTRLEALALSERRVQIAEQREARAQRAISSPQTPAKPSVVTEQEMTRYVKGLLGKEVTIGDELLDDSACHP